MKLLDFKNKNEQRIYNNYMDRCNKKLKILSHVDKEECLQEINSYIFEYLASEKGKDEMENLLIILDRLGPPEETLQEYIASKKIEQAIKTFNPKHLIEALLLNISNGFIFILLLILALLFLCFPVLIVLKLINPQEVGLFTGSGNFFIGQFTGTSSLKEHLGNFFIPAAILFSVLIYVLILYLLKIKSKMNIKLKINLQS